MDTIDIALNKFIQYMSELGLENWQLLIIAIAIIILLILIAKRQRKPKARLIHTIQPINQPEIIGKKLYNREETNPKVEDTKQHQPAPTPAKKHIKGEKTNLRQTTKEWRKATEQIRLLRREVTKQKRTEEQLRQKIVELSISSQQTGYETKENEHVQHHVKSQHSVPQTTEIQIQEVNQGEQADKKMKQLLEKNAATNQEHLLEFPKTEQTTKQQSADSISSTEQSPQELTDHHNRDQEPIGKEINNRSNSKRHGVPLDIQELKSIAELAKRLQRKNHQQQNK